MFIDNAFEALSFVTLTSIVFSDFFVGSTIAVYKDAYEKWYDEHENVVWLPGRWVFPVVWVANYVLVDTSIYVFFKFMYPVIPEETYVVPTIIVLFTVNMMLSKKWPEVFIQHRYNRMGLCMSFLLAGTGIGMLVVYGLNRRNIELGTFVFYVFCCCCCFLLNLQVWRAENGHHHHHKHKHHKGTDAVIVDYSDAVSTELSGF
jgi:tryptophan-rich sensory protein